MNKIAYTSYLILLLCIYSCKSGEVKSEAIPKINTSLLEEGDIIFRKCEGLISDFFARYQKEGLYSHAGFIHFKNDSCFIIHAEILDGVDKADGDIHCQALDDFLADAVNWAVYRLDTNLIVRSRLTIEALEYKTKKCKFDKKFDATNDEAIYCTELIAVVVNKVFENTIILTSPTVGGIEVYHVEDIYNIPQMSLVDLNKKPD